MIILITLICILIASALFAGAFYLAKHVVGLQHRNNVLEDSYNEAVAHIAELEKHITMMQQELDFIRRDEEMNAQRTKRERVWNPGDPLNSGTRTI